MRLAIIQLDDVVDGERKARVTYAGRSDLYSFDELKAMVKQLHGIYDAVCAGRAEDVRRCADEDLPDDKRTEMEKKWRRGAYGISLAEEPVVIGS